jgi:hypothetical protein
VSESFSGLGLIFYVPPMRLPVVPLGDESLFLPSLPIRGITAIAQTLARISVIGSPWHDGFHLIDVQALAITHLSQFFAPPLEAAASLRASATPIGARQMAAILGSTLPTVDCTALLSKGGEPLMFRKGIQT